MQELRKLDELDSSFIDFDIYGELFVCSNRLLKTSHIFKTTDGWSPLVVRKASDGSQLPAVWLSVKIDRKDECGYIELVSGNTQKFFDNQFEFDVTKDGFYIAINSVVICEAGDVQEDSLEIFKLDLRPLGLNIYGEHNKLLIGSNEMSRNTSNNAECMFGI